MCAQFAIHHYTDSPAYYDIMLEHGDSISTFRIVQFDMLALLDGTEVKAELIDSGTAVSTPVDKPINCGSATVRLFDSGLCATERWSPPVFMVHVMGRQFYGTLHVLKVEEGYSLRYVRSRSQKQLHR